MKNPLLRGYALLWALFAAASLSGWIHASTWDFAIQNTLHCFGLACYAMSLCLMLERDPKHFARQLFIAILTGAAFSIYSALNQYWSGFEETRKFIEEKERATGQQIMTGQFASRLMESRVSGDFAVCNVYAGYLALVFPLILAVLYRFGGRVTPPWAARLILCGGGGALYLFLLKETGSRGGILALIVGIAFTILAFRIPRRIRFFCYALIPVMLAGFVILVKMWRGFASMLFRFDYFKAAFEMMLAHPLSGAGWGEFFHEYLIYKDLINDEAPHGPHNFILALGSQSGVCAFLLAGILLLIPCAAALILFYKSLRTEPAEADEKIIHCGMAIAVVSWTVHAMIELDYETPGATATAIALGSLILASKGADRILKLPLPETPKGVSVLNLLFLLISAGLIVYPALKLPQVVAAEMAYERLHSATDVRFGTPQKGTSPVTPDDVARMLRTCIDLQILEDRIAQTGLRKHAAHGLLHHERGLLLQVISGRSETLPARITRVSYIDLVGQFVARELHLLRIDHDDIITAIGVGSVAGLVLAAKDLGHLRSKTSQHLVRCVYHHPFLGDGSRIRRDGFVTQ